MTAYNKPKETEFLTLIVRKQKQERQKAQEQALLEGFVVLPSGIILPKE